MRTSYTNTRYAVLFNVPVKLISYRSVIGLEPIASRRIAELVPTAPSSATQLSVLRLRGKFAESEDLSS